MPDEQQAYLQQLTRHVRSVLRRGAKSLNEVVEVAGGAYPSDVLTVLQSLVASGEANERGGLYLDETYAGASPYNIPDVDVSTSKGGVDTRLPESHYSDPHPADYDWRYSSCALPELYARLVPFLKSGEGVALLGAVTLFPVLAAHSGEVALFDRSASALADLREMGFEKGLFRHDLFDPIPGVAGTYAAVVGDPPWYPEFHRAFILRASELLKEQGLLLLSVLPWLTRPTAVADRCDIVEFATRAGFDLAELTPGILRYQSPKFEQVALSLKGIHCGEWRTGDLYVFRRVRETESGLSVARPQDEPEWDEYRLGRQKVKLRRRPEQDPTGFSVRPASDNGALLTEVSRRSAVRPRIDLWTSDNAAYAIRGREILHQALQRLETGASPSVVVASFPPELLSGDESAALLRLLRQLVAGKTV